MTAHNRAPRPRQPRIRVFHAYQLMAALQRLAPRTRRRMTRQIALSAVQAMVVLKRGLEISYHPFEAAGLDLVLSSRWSAPHATLTIEVDMRGKGAPRLTLVGGLPPPPARWGRLRD